MDVLNVTSAKPILVNFISIHFQIDACKRNAADQMYLSADSRFNGNTQIMFDFFFGRFE